MDKTLINMIASKQFKVDIDVILTHFPDMVLLSFCNFKKLVIHFKTSKYYGTYIKDTDDVTIFRLKDL